jgi:hypothetical protein
MLLFLAHLARGRDSDCEGQLERTLLNTATFTEHIINLLELLQVLISVGVTMGSAASAAFPPSSTAQASSSTSPTRGRHPMVAGQFVNQHKLQCLGCRQGAMCWWQRTPAK